MFEIFFKLFKLSIKFEIKYEGSKKPIKVKNDYFAEESEETFDKPKEEKPSFFDLKANQFEQELKAFGIVDIPEPPDEFNINNPDLPRRFNNMNDDVEIITDRYEKEIEDLYEGRR